MKNKILYLFIFIVGGLVSCDKDNSADYIFDKSVNERFSELYTEYNTALQTPENGWLGYYNPNGDTGAFSVLLKFKSDGSVIMHSDWNHGNSNDTITYSITKKQDVTLTFESWSVLHDIYEEKNNNNGGEYVFNISEVSNEEIVLVSKTDNGYDGEDVTKLVLKPATVENWDLTNVYASALNIAGDATKSVFRNFNADGTPIASFNYNANSRSATLSYAKDGGVVKENVPVVIKPNGMCFVKPVTIGDKTLDCFTYNTEDGTYSDESGSVKLIYDMVPAVPFDAYDFGARPNTRDNYLDSNDKSSLAYRNFIAGYANLVNADIQINRVYFRDLGKADTTPWLYIYTNQGNFWFNFNYEIKEDRKLYITLTGDNNAGTNLPLFQPLLDLFDNENGHYIEGTGTLERYTNKTFSIINADNPSFVINFYEWG
ncbi:DUF4302 domain-containing protein [Ancylomarina sp. DW003]|nr:DUF4302 domain-containing protein [Ancylomarina sp. DW003]MDE5420727.1 DUF4302 domain-containing protein [Ancylomarina sp. DW003]